MGTQTRITLRGRTRFANTIHGPCRLTSLPRMCRSMLQSAVSGIPALNQVQTHEELGTPHQRRHRKTYTATCQPVPTRRKTDQTAGSFFLQPLHLRHHESDRTTYLMPPHPSGIHGPPGHDDAQSAGSGLPRYRRLQDQSAEIRDAHIYDLDFRARGSVR
jgi:hypothetical protein